MNRADKIAKLCHAVKDWRGVIDLKSGKWIKPPKIGAGGRVIKWLIELGLNAEQERTRISQFTKYADFYAWVRSIDGQNPTGQPPAAPAGSAGPGCCVSESEKGEQ